ncbi:MAG: OmpH family outer membrane protein [Saccharospirillum sp.]|nr:OmpH family outer membrane protein [Saccharospirillum sp.]
MKQNPIQVCLKCMRFSAKYAAILMLGLGMAAAVKAADIAILDQNFVLFGSEAAEEATAQLRSEYAEQEQQVQTLEQAIRQLQSRARTDGDIMTEDEMRQLEQEAQQRLAQREQLVRQLQQVQNERRSAFVERFQPMLAQAIERAVGDNQYDLIIDKSAVIYHRNSLDITEAVLEEFNALYRAQ